MTRKAWVVMLGLFGRNSVAILRHASLLFLVSETLSYPPSSLTRLYSRKRSMCRLPTLGSRSRTVLHVGSICVHRRPAQKKTHPRFSWYSAKVFRKSSYSWVRSTDDSSGLFGAMLRLSHLLETTWKLVAIHAWMQLCARHNGGSTRGCAARVGRDDGWTNTRTLECTKSLASRVDTHGPYHVTEVTGCDSLKPRPTISPTVFPRNLSALVSPW